MFFKGLLGSLLMELAKKIETHSDNIFLKPLVIFDESLVSNRFEDESMDSVACFKMIPDVLILIAFRLKFLFNAFYLVGIVFHGCPLDDLAFQDLTNLKDFPNILDGDSWNKRSLPWNIFNKSLFLELL